MTERLDLDAIAARADAATPGPWGPTEDMNPGNPDTGIGVASGWDGDVYTSMIVTTPGDGSFDIGEPTDREANAEFIASARTDVPALLAALAERAAAIAAARETVKDAMRAPRGHAWRHLSDLVRALDGAP